MFISDNKYINIHKVKKYINIHTCYALTVHGKRVKKYIQK